MAGNGSEGLDPRTVRAELERIRTEVESGNTDLKGLGFWALVGRLKRHPELADEFADEVGAIDRAAFERRFKVRPPVWLGNLVLLLGSGAMLGLMIVGVALALPEGLWFVVDDGELLETIVLNNDRFWPGVMLLVAAGGLSVTAHAPAHWIVGRLGDIRFSSYFFDGPFRIQPGVKTDYASYLRATPRARARMHAAGAVASKVAPFLVFAAAYVPHILYDWELLPEWSLWGVLGLGVVQIVTDVVWSTKRSDWKKWRRERRVAAELRGG